VPRLGRYLSGLIPSVLRPSQLYPGEVSGGAVEEKKTQKYSDIVSGVDFSPFAIETSGVGQSMLWISSLNSTVEWQL